jgi:DNA-binding winged helix-turn-helix (wHTH) protein
MRRVTVEILRKRTKHNAQCRLKIMAPSTRMALTFSKENQTFNGLAYRFADLVLVPAERMLTRADISVSIQPKTFDALLLLVLHAGHLVSKTELMRLLWPHTHVKETNLTNVIVSLRKLLGRESIRTVSKHGYRFDLPILCEPGVDGVTYEFFLQARSIIQTRSLEDMPRARDLLSLCIAKSPNFLQAGRGLDAAVCFWISSAKVLRSMVTSLRPPWKEP